MSPRTGIESSSPQPGNLRSYEQRNAIMSSLLCRFRKVVSASYAPLALNPSIIYTRVGKIAQRRTSEPRLFRDAGDLLLMLH